ADVLDAGDEVANLARTKRAHRRRRRTADANLFDLVGRTGLHEAKAGPGAQLAIHHPHGADDAAVLVVVRVEDEALQRRRPIALGRRDALNDRIEQLGHALAGLGAEPQDAVGGYAE